MSSDEIVALILSLPSAEQSSHFGNADFRVGGKIFASHPKPGQFNLNLTPEQQAELSPQAGATTTPSNGRGQPRRPGR